MEELAKQLQENNKMLHEIAIQLSIIADVLRSEQIRKNRKREAKAEGYRFNKVTKHFT
ncbi:hypothetical protein GCM10011383_38810 [Hymenobacter cavernae]|uniref:DNA-binding protein n=1 Tax=Hymenobacter cavernae TaxID=2044852 RepID=A0ABQ1UQE1_9BACT|nr:hypothetical protein GCM10011383_38810 [Hymenobacter cavernae]